MKRTIVLGSNYAALGAIRTLASEGIEVIHLSTDRFYIARFSIFVTRSVKAPSPTRESSRLLEFLMNTNENWDGALLLPTNDPSVVFVSKNRQTLAERYIPAVQDWNLIERIIDKKSLYIQAQKIDDPTPKVVFPDSVQALMEINIRPVLPELHFVAAGINFPFITYLDLVEGLKTERLVYPRFRTQKR